MNEWKTFKLGELVSINEKSIGNSYQYSQIRYLDTSSVTQNSFDSELIIELKDAPSRAKRIVKDGDTIISTVRPIQKHFGFIQNVKPNTIVSTGFAVMTPKKIIPEFLYYFISQDNITEYLNGIAETSTTTFPAFRPDVLKDLEISLPDIKTQQRIASILSSLDDKIELNHQTNQTLENIAQKLFQEMCVTKGEELPEGWRVGKLNEVVDIVMGQSPAGTSFNQNQEGIIFFQGKAEFGFRFPEIDKYTTEPKRYAYKLDTLLSVRAPVGTINMASEKCCIGRGLAAISGKNNCWSYAFHLSKSLSERFEMYNGEGTVFGSINKIDLENLELIIPTENVIQEFELKAEALDNLVFTNEQETQTLIALRDSLLPKLMKGEIEV